MSVAFRVPLIVLVALVLLLPGAKASATPLAPFIDLQEAGLTVDTDAAGLEDWDEAAPINLTVDIGGSVRFALLYWAGRETNCTLVGSDCTFLQPFDDQQIEFEGNDITGTVIGTETQPVTPDGPTLNISYFADVTSLVSAAGAGTQSFTFEDDAAADLSDRDGVALFVAYTNASDTTIYRVMVWDNGDFAAPADETPGGTRNVAPVTFGHGTTDSARTAELYLGVGAASLLGGDEVNITNNTSLFDTLDASNGDQYDLDVHTINIPADSGTTSVDLLPTCEEEVFWQFAALRVAVPPVMDGARSDAQPASRGESAPPDCTQPPDLRELCLTLELDATQVNNNLGINNLQNNDVVCAEGVLEEPDQASRGQETPFYLLFDGSDVGITRTIIDGMDVLTSEIGQTAARGSEEFPNDILLSFNVAHSIPPLGLVLQSDIIRFVADQTGSQTAGQFERFFDGSDIGLTAGGEDIDAFMLLDTFTLLPAAERGAPPPNTVGHLIFSTQGAGSAQGVSWQDEDLVICLFLTLSPGEGGDIESSCELLALLFDGSEAGLAAASEDVDAFTIDIAPAVEGADRGITFAAHFFLSTRGNFQLDGVSGRNEDVFRCTGAIFSVDGARGEDTVEPLTECTSVGIVFDGSDYGLGANNVFSIDLRGPICIESASRGACRD